MFECFVVFMLALTNGVFALAEMSLITARKTRLKALAETSRGARAALELQEHPGRLLSMVQICITLVGVVAGAYGGSSIAALIAPMLDFLPLSASQTEWTAFFLAASLITVVTLLFGELAPKRLALLNAERIAVLTAIPMLTISRLASPLISLLSKATDLILLPFKAFNSTENDIQVEQEIRQLLTEASQSGEIEKDDQHLMERALDLSDRDLESIMTPRHQVTWLDINEPIEDLLATMRETRHSAYPVADAELDETLGVLVLNDIVGMTAAEIAPRRRELLREPVFAPASGRIYTLLNTLRKKHQRLALIVDEYGSIVGALSTTDLYKALTGMQSGNVEVDPAIRRREDGSYLVDGALPLPELRQLLGVAELPLMEEDDVNTLAGMLIARLGHIPKLGERYRWQQFLFEVVDRDGQRVDKVLISGEQPAAERLLAS
jgi:putative hemolysin